MESWLLALKANYFTASSQNKDRPQQSALCWECHLIRLKRAIQSISLCKPSKQLKHRTVYANRKLICPQGFEKAQYGIEIICLIICLLNYTLRRKLAKSYKTLPFGISGNILKGFYILKYSNIFVCFILKELRNRIRNIILK